MFWAKKDENKEKQKILKKMRDKKAQIEKLKEEITTMSKLVLKDGKLQRVETGGRPSEQPKQEPEPQPRPMAEPPQPPPEFDTRMVPPPQPPTPPQFAQPQFQQMYDPRLIQQYQQMQQYQQPMPQYQQPMSPSQPVQITVTLKLCNAEDMEVNVAETEFEAFIQRLNEILVDGGILPIGNTFINGRNVVAYVIE